MVGCGAQHSGAVGQQGWAAQWDWGWWGGGDGGHSIAGLGVMGWWGGGHSSVGLRAMGRWGCGAALWASHEKGPLLLCPPPRSAHPRIPRSDSPHLPDRPHSSPPHSSPPRPHSAPPRPIHPPPISSPRPLIGSFSHQSVRSGSSGPASFGLGALSRKHVIERRMRGARTGSTCSGGACAVQVPEWAGGAPRPTAPSPHTP